MLPKLIYDREALENFDFTIPKYGFMNLAEVAGVETSNIDEFTLALSGVAKAGGTWGDYSLTTYQRPDGEKQLRHAKITVHLANFVGYGAFGITINGDKNNVLSPRELDNLNFTSVVMHELLHMARIERREAGSTVDVIRRRVGAQAWNALGSPVDPEENTVRYLTYRHMRHHPELAQSLHVVHR